MAVHLEQLWAELPDAVVFADTQGVIQAWNAAAERVFGFSAIEAIGQNLDIIVPERFREAHWTGFDRALTAGATKYEGRALPTRALPTRALPTRALRKDGEQIYVELAFAIVLEEGVAVGALATARDITERFESDRELRRELRALRERLQGGGEASAGPTTG